jgi:hypothetical protein
MYLGEDAQFFVDFRNSPLPPQKKLDKKFKILRVKLTSVQSDIVWNKSNFILDLKTRMSGCSKNH